MEYRKELEKALTLKINILNLMIAYEFANSGCDLNEENFENACQLIKQAWLKSNLSMEELINTLNIILTNENIQLSKFNYKDLINKTIEMRNE